MPGKLLASLVQDLRAVLDRDPVTTGPGLHQAVQVVVADAPACVLVADSKGQLVGASLIALAVLGHTLTSIRRLNVTTLAASEEVESVEPLWESFLRERRQSGSFMLRRKDGTSVRTRYAAQANAVAGLSIAVHLVTEESTLRD